MILTTESPTRPGHTDRGETTVAEAMPGPEVHPTEAAGPQERLRGIPAITISPPPRRKKNTGEGDYKSGEDLRPTFWTIGHTFNLLGVPSFEWGIIRSS